MPAIPSRGATRSRSSLWGLIWLAAAISPAPSQSTAAVELEATAGFDGKARSGFWTPVQVHVDADRSGFRGLAQFELTSPTGAPLRYEAELYAPQGYSAARFLYALPSSLHSTAITVSADNSLGPDPAAVKCQLALIPPQTQWTVLVDGSSSAKAESQVVSAVPSASLPPLADAYLPVDLLVFAMPAHVASPPPATTRAIERWVESGGALVVCVGRTAEKLADTSWERWLPGTPSTETWLERPRELERFARSEEPLPRRVHVSTFTERPVPEEAPATPVVVEGDVPLLWRRDVGSGTVWLLAIDVAQGNTDNWPGWPSVWSRLCSRSWLNPRSQLRTRGEPSPAGRVSLDPAKVEPSPLHTGVVLARETYAYLVPVSLTTLLVVVLLYFAWIGPVERWLLRRIRRPSWTWWMLPVAALGLFSVSLLYLGRNRAATSDTRSLNWWTIDLASDSAERVGLFSIYSPVGTYYDLRSSAIGTRVRPLSDEPVGLGGELAPALGGILAEGSQTLRDSPQYANSMKVFASEWRGAPPGALALSVTGDDASLLRNDSSLTLRDPVLVFPDETYVELDDLAPGAVLELDSARDRARGNGWTAGSLRQRLAYWQSDAFVAPQEEIEPTQAARATFARWGRQLLWSYSLNAWRDQYRGRHGGVRIAFAHPSRHRPLHRRLLQPVTDRRPMLIAEIDSDPHSIEVDGRRQHGIHLTMLRVFLPSTEASQ